MAASQTPLYQDLPGHDDTRVLHIDPALRGDRTVPLSGRLRTITLSDMIDEVYTESYIALSYCWGAVHSDGSHSTHMIICDGREVRITANLHGALIRLREHLDKGNLNDDTTNNSSERLPLWIDAICVNQRDIKERNRQVEMMPRIYRESKKMVIWLGEAQMGDTNLLRKGVTSLPVETKSFYVMPDHDNPYFTWNDQELRRSSPIDVDSWKQQISPNDRLRIASILHQSWFGRRWVVQEAMLATTPLVMYGDLLISAERLVDLLKRCEAPDNNLLRQCLLFRQGEEVGFLQSMQAFDKLLCSDDRDRIYALSGVYRDFSVRIDYPESVEMLYYRIAVSLVEDGHAAEVLAVASSRLGANEAASESSRRILPSWVPDWRTTVQYSSANHERVLEAVLKWSLNEYPEQARETLHLDHRNTG
ncbi:hypothetical protein LTR86_009193 [Recurvomyces mirabilis]|nr:hypothetical protein LTR86_009193 [Recurvomyces mirabilis]